MLGLRKVSKDLKHLGSALPARQSCSTQASRACSSESQDPPLPENGTVLLPGWGEHNETRCCSVCSSQGKSATAVSAPWGGERRRTVCATGARTGSARFCSRGWPEIMPLCPGAATAPTAGPHWRRALWTRASQRCSLPSGARPLPSPPVPSRRRGHASASAGNLATAPDFVTSPLRAAPTRPGRAFVLSSLGAGAEF